MPVVRWVESEKIDADSIAEYFYVSHLLLGSHSIKKDDTGASADHTVFVCLIVNKILILFAQSHHLQELIQWQEV